MNAVVSFFPLVCQSNTVLHLDLVTGAVRRLILSQDSEPSPGKVSNWWSSKEQQVRWHFFSVCLLLLFYV